MTKHTEEQWVGLDVSDRETTYVVLDKEGTVVSRGKVATAAPALARAFRSFARSVMVLEAGTHSPWLSRVLKGEGHRVIVANPRQVQLIARGRRKSDREDAETLARLARADERMLFAIQHRGERAQVALDLVRARDHLVGQRTATINHVRATVKAHGRRLPSCSAEVFPRKAVAALGEELSVALGPLLEEVAELTAKIRAYDRKVELLSAKEYPETGLLKQVVGVGPLTALTYVLVLEEQGRFKKSRQVGSYLGLAPRLRESGEQRPQPRISKAGDVYLRKLLVQCAHYILGPFGKASALREWGLKLAGEGNGARKKRALIAVARKLAVLMHRLWVTGEVYEPFPGGGLSRSPLE
jgi:transposase